MNTLAEEILACVPQKWKDGKMSDHAAAAATIRTFLKKKGIKASVSSESFAGGNSVHVTITDALPSIRDLFNNIEKMFEFGSFDGMRDLYEYKNSSELIAGLPTVKYCIIDCEYSDALREKALNFMKNRFADGTPEKEIEDWAIRCLKADSWRIKSSVLFSDFWKKIEDETKKTETSKSVYSSESVTDKDAEFIETDRFFQVKFSAKPAAEVLENLKKNGFKWFSPFGYWGTFKNGRTAEQVKQALNFA